MSFVVTVFISQKLRSTSPTVRAGFSWWEAWGQLVGGQCPAIT